MRGLQIIEVAPGTEGVLDLVHALKSRFGDDGPAVAPVPTPSRHVSSEYVAGVRGALASGASGVPLEVAAVLTTSGSTGRPRGVLVTNANLRSAAAAADLARPGLADCSWVLALPATSIGGFNVVVRSVLADRPLHVLPSVGGASAFDPASLIDLSLEGPFAISIVPSQLRAILDVPEATTALSLAHTVLIGGSATPAELLTRARAAGIPAIPTYGMTETTGGCVFDGAALPEVAVALDDSGHIIIGGPLVAAGYLDAQIDDGFLDGPRFRTHDLGRWERQRLEVLGRADDIVTVNGVNVSLHAIEDLLREQSGVHEAAVVGVPDDVTGHRIIAYVVPDDGARGPWVDVVRTRLGGAARPEVVEVDTLPHLPNGKIDRLALRARGR